MVRRVMLGVPGTSLPALSAALFLSSLVILAVAGCSSGKKRESSQVRLDEENRRLVSMHNDIWIRMGLSENAQNELNRVVLTVKKDIRESAFHGPEYKEPAEKRDPNWRERSYDDHVKKHKEHFAKLGISQPTQDELFKAMDFLWRALHDPNVPEKDKEAAKKIVSAHVPY